MSIFHFTGRNHGGKIIGIDIAFRGFFKSNKPKILDKFINWLLNRRIAQSDIKSIVITTLQKRQKKEFDKIDFVV